MAELIRSRPIATQQELLEALNAQGAGVTQATVSRDLRALGVVKGPDGYRLPGNGEAALAVLEGEEALRRAVVSVRLAHALVVVQTPPGHANAVATLIDRMRPDEMVGSIAGDDTIFLATPDPEAARQLRRRLAEEFEIEPEA